MAKFKVDFSDVEETSAEVVPGKYVVQVEDITQEEGEEYPYLMWQLKILTGKSKGLHVRHITSFKPSALFNLRNTLIALGLKVPKAAVAIDTKALKGKRFGVEIAMREYKGKDYPNVKKVFHKSDVIEVDEPTSVDVDDDLDEIMDL